MPGSRRLRRGIYLLPTLFTVGNLFCGFTALLHASRGGFREAAALIFIAGLLDVLDGRIARLTGTTSEFGVEFDSLADLVSFGVAPAFLAWEWALSPLHRIGWLATFLFVLCAAMRLARFNIQTTTASRKYFAGLPSPAAAGAVACLPLARPLPPEPVWASAVVAGVIATIAILMISRVRYRSFKDFDLRGRRSYLWALPVAALLGIMWLTPVGALAVLAGSYVISGPLGWLIGLIRKAAGRPPLGGEERTRGSEIVDEPLSR